MRDWQVGALAKAAFYSFLAVGNFYLAVREVSKVV